MKYLHLWPYCIVPPKDLSLTKHNPLITSYFFYDDLHPHLCNQRISLCHSTVVCSKVASGHFHPLTHIGTLNPWELVLIVWFYLSIGICLLEGKGGLECVLPSLFVDLVSLKLVLRRLALKHRHIYDRLMFLLWPTSLYSFLLGLKVNFSHNWAAPPALQG